MAVDSAAAIRQPTCFWSNIELPGERRLAANQPAPFTNADDARAATGAFIPNQSLPYSETWNLGVQHVFAQKYTLEVRYVGTRGIHLPVQTRSEPSGNKPA